MSNFKVVFSILLMLIALCAPVHAGTIYVDAGAGGGDGSSWGNAYTDLQAAIDVAASGDEVWVAAGTYYPTLQPTEIDTADTRYNHFALKNGVAVYGGFAGDEDSATFDLTDRDFTTNETILSGDIDNDGLDNGNVYHVFYHPSSLALTSDAVLDGVTITGGYADGSGPQYSGGGMYNAYASPAITSCTFSGNSAVNGGGMYNFESSSPTLADCTFQGNSVTNGGGGMYNASSSPAITNCIFSGNSSDVYGGGMQNASSSATIENCIFSGNSAASYAGGMRNYQSSPTLTNCTFSGNSAGDYGGGMVNHSSSSPTITNCILWGDTATSSGNEVYNSGSTPTFSYCDIEGSGGSSSWGSGLGTDNGNNIDSDPLFAGDDIHLTASSPCVDSGDNASAADIKTDMDDEMRIYDGDFDLTATVDIGADEYIGADADGNGLPDDWETHYGVSDPDLDSDADGLSNLDEFCLGTDPTMADSDGDGTDDGNEDYDGDGLSNSEEIDTYGTDPKDTDTDGDGLNDPDELAYWGDDWDADPDGDGLINILDDDSDDDGISDSEEDFDGDGLSNGEEINTYGTDPALADSDGDGMNDSDELSLWGDDWSDDPDGDGLINILDDDSDDDGISDSEEDFDGDGLSNGEEINTYGSDPNDTDTDDDGLSDYDEAITYGTDPADSDTDGDGFGDWVEVVFGSSPTNTGDTPSPITIYVDVDATSGSNNGLSWADAYTDLSTAINAADTVAKNSVEVVSVWVAAGTYYPTLWPNGGSEARERHFTMENGVSIYGGFAGDEDPDTLDLADRDFVANETTLSGDIGTVGDASDNCYHVFYHPDGADLDGTAVLSGFTISGGYANGSYTHSYGGGMYNDCSSSTIENCTFSGNSASYGGGMYNTEASPTITNCTFSGNSADSDGGGMYNDGGFYSRYETSPTITNCTFSGNSAGNDGGGMNNSYGSTPTIEDCTFTLNSSNEEGGGICNDNYSSPTIKNCEFSRNSADNGGGMHNAGYSSPTIENCEFSRNSADNGGGMHNAGYSSPTIKNCEFSRNSADNGGGMTISRSTPSITNCTFSRNSADNGGGIYSYNYSSPTIEDCTFTLNSAIDGGGIHNDGGADSSSNAPTITNCTFFGNSVSSRGGGMYNGGSGIVNQYFSPAVENCTFSGNSANSSGGGMCNYLCSPTIENCTFSGNSANSSGGGMYNYSSTPTVTNCILWGDTAGSENELYNPFSTITSSHNSINIDPLFVRNPGTNGSVDYGDLHLRDGSPCIDAGDDDSASGITEDMDGETRFSGTVDIGADEFVDSDDDGLSDYEEEDIYNTDPTDSDSDDDGLSDDDEVSRGTDPLDSDSDDDGLSDGDEVNIWGTDPLDSDSDNDGIYDGNEDDDGDGLSNADEVNIYGTDPLVSDADADTDGDGLTNVDEVDIYGTDPLVSDTDADTDGDGLTNVDEVDIYGTSPTDSDSDDDGVSDGDEIFYGTDPLTANDVSGVPVLSSPEDTATEIALYSALSAEYTDASFAENHAATRWQIALDDGFTALVLDITSESFLLDLQVPDLVLEGETTYFWRVLFTAADGSAIWSRPRSFTTAVDGRDEDGNGLPDDQELSGDEVEITVDAEDGWNADLFVLSTYAEDGADLQAGLRLSDDGSDLYLFSHTAVDDLDEACPGELAMGVFSMKLTVSEAGASTLVRLYFSPSYLEEDSVIYKYDPVYGWYDYTGYTTISDDLSYLIIELTDGGYGDADGVANGVIVDPLGAALGEDEDESDNGGSGDNADTDDGETDTSAGSSGSGGGGCFISSIFEW